MNIKPFLVAALAACVMAGCATTPSTARTDCFNPSRIRDFQVVGPGVVQVHASAGSWEVQTSASCPGLDNARALAFTDRPVLSSWQGASLVPRWHVPPWYTYNQWDHRFDVPVISPASRICGYSGEVLLPVWPRSSWGFPNAGCPVLSVKRLD